VPKCRHKPTCSTGDPTPVKACNKNIQQTIALSAKMIALADRGDADREDTGCGILYGVLRDAGYKIRKMALIERENHRRKGVWQEDGSQPAASAAPEST